MTSKIQVDFRFNTYSEVLVTVSCRFFKFLHYLCFLGQGILWWHSYWATMFGRTSQIQVTLRFKRFSRLPKHSFLDKNDLNLKAVARKSRDGHTTNALSSILLSCHVMSRHATLSHVMSCHITSCHVMTRYSTSCHVMSRQVTSCHVMPRHVMSCHVTSCHVM